MEPDSNAPQPQPSTPAVDDDAKRLLPLAKVARRLGVPLKWLRAEAQFGRIPHLDAGGRILAVAEAVELALTKRAAGTAASGPGGKD